MKPFWISPEKATATKKLWDKAALAGGKFHAFSEEEFAKLLPKNVPRTVKTHLEG